MSFISKDFLNADANCPDYVITASEMIEMLEDAGDQGNDHLCFIPTDVRV